MAKKWGVFEWGGGTDTPMHTMNLAIFLTVVLIYRCQFTDKDLFFRTIHTKTISNSQRNKKNRLNTLSHRLLGGPLEVPTKYYVEIKIM